MTETASAHKYVCVKSPTDQSWEVGYYDARGKWEPEDDKYSSPEAAAPRVHYLNGGCDGSGWVQVIRGGVSGVKECECRKVRVANSSVERSGIPDKFRKASFDTFDVSASRDALGRALLSVKTFAREFPVLDRPGLLLFGPSGSGKTHLGISLLRELMKRGHNCLFVDNNLLMELIRSTYGEAFESDIGIPPELVDKPLERAFDAGVLLLDDLGGNRMTEWVRDTVQKIVVARYNAGRPIIVTTQLSDEMVSGLDLEYTTPGGQKIYKKSLREVLGDHTRSRLMEMCEFCVLPEVNHRTAKRTRRG